MRVVVSSGDEMVGTTGDEPSSASCCSICCERPCSADTAALAASNSNLGSSSCSSVSCRSSSSVDAPMPANGVMVVAADGVRAARRRAPVRATAERR